MGTLFQELKRRNIFKVGAAYLVLSWLLLQVGSVLVPILKLPEVVMPVVVFFLLLGFPLALLFAWAFELTPEGLKRAKEVEPSQSVTDATGRKLNVLTSGLLIVLIVFLVADRYLLGSDVSDQRAEVSLEDLHSRTYESIAVLPFVNMSDDQQQDYFSDGISEELLNLLAKTKGLRVAARTSSFAYKGHNQNIRKIGEDLDVQTVLEGSVRKAKTKLRITAQLIDVDTGYHLWSETYDRELEDIFAIQDEISEAIVSALQVHFGGEVSVAPKQSYQPSLIAYESYLKGQELMKKRTKADIEDALELFSKAIEIDPKFALAYTGKANAYMLLSDRPGAYGDIPVKYAIDFSKPLVDIALELDPDLAEAHNAHGFLLHSDDKEEEALVAYNRAIELSPSFAIAHMWRSQLIDDMDGSETGTPYLEAAYKLDPMSPLLIQNLANRYVDLLRFDEVDYLVKKLEEIAPDKAQRVALIKGRLLQAKGEYAAAYRILRDNNDGTSIYKNNLAGVASVLNNREEYYKNASRGQIFWFCLRIEDVACAEEKMLESSQEFQDSEVGHYAKFILALTQRDYRAAEAELLQTKFDPDDFDASFHGDIFSLGSPEVALFYRKVGNEDMAQALIAYSDKRLAAAKAEGYEFLTYEVEAQVEVLKGHPDKAIALMRKAHDAYGLRWTHQFQLLIRDLNGLPEFDALDSEIIAHVNEERVKLGWDALPPDAFNSAKENG